MAIYDQALPADHDAFAYVRALLGDAGRATGDLDAARSEYERAVAIWEQGRGFGYVGLAAPLTGLGWLALARGAVAARACSPVNGATSEPVTLDASWSSR